MTQNNNNARAAKRKGKRLEKKISKELQDLTGLDEDDIKPAIGAEAGEDIKMSKIAKEKIPLSIECKTRKQFTIYKYWDQCKKNTPEGRQSCLIIRADRREPLVITSLSTLEKFIKENNNGQS